MWRDTTTAACRLALLFTVCLLGPLRARAQDVPQTSLYVFGGSGQVTPKDVFTYWGGPTVCAGAGVEQQLGSGVMLVGDLEYLYRSTSPGDKAVLLPSVNVAFGFGRARVRPLVTGGYTFESGSAVFNYGGGVNYWLHRRFGLRFELRDHLMIFDPTLHAYGVRFGFTVG